MGIAVEKAPTAYAEFAAHAVEPLFASIGEVDTSDNEALFARDNAVSARTSAHQRDVRLEAHVICTRSCQDHQRQQVER